MIDLGVAVVVVDDGGVLLVEREDSDVWCLPGGGVDDGESVAAAAVREVEEEPGILVRLERLVGVCSRPGWSSHQAIFFGRRVGGNLQVRTGETNAAEFFNPRDMPLIVPWHR